MSVDVLQHHPDPRQVKREPAIPSGVLGMLIFVIAEVMFFAGLISAYLIVRASVRGGVWPPPNQPRLPIEETAFNTVVLLASGALLLLAERALRTTGQEKKATRFLAASIATGVFFVVFQGNEWAALIAQGLTLTSSAHGSFFYMIIGTHALHAIGALIGLSWALWKHSKRALRVRELQAALVFWMFVVGIWPILYWLVYLS
jgi:cytochrome c oxidase subunit 3